MARARGPAPSLLPSPAVLLTAAVAVIAVLMAGCGAGTSLLTGHARHHPGVAASHRPIAGFGKRTIPTPAPTGSAPDPGAVKVIRGWSTALRRGDVRAAAAYFRTPSELINGIGGNGVPLLILIRSRGQAEAANETLPCGARLISADQRGRYVNALFRLTGRPGPGGSGCGSGVGETARTNFLIVNGRIVEWIRAPDDPGDNGSPATPRSSPTPGPLV